MVAVLQFAPFPMTAFKTWSSRVATGTGSAKSIGVGRTSPDNNLFKNAATQIIKRRTEGKYFIYIYISFITRSADR
jgi:hypothetical protein